jgi:XTP/dITP diphosphohydrolase
MDAVRGTEKAIAAERRGADVPEELDITRLGVITEEEWRAYWPPAVQEQIVEDEPEDELDEPEDEVDEPKDEADDAAESSVAPGDGEPEKAVVEGVVADGDAPEGSADD